MTVAGDIDAIERRLSGASPVLGVLSRVKNECDIIEAFVRHHAGLVDRIIVVDNGSQDGTSEILAALVEEGLPLAVLADPTLEYRQAEIMTYLTRAGIRGFVARNTRYGFFGFNDNFVDLDNGDVGVLPGRDQRETAAVELLGR